MNINLEKDLLASTSQETSQILLQSEECKSISLSDLPPKKRESKANFKAVVQESHPPRKQQTRYPESETDRQWTQAFEMLNKVSPSLKTAAPVSQGNMLPS
jgi:hypothetical protein